MQKIKIGTEFSRIFQQAQEQVEAFSLFDSEQLQQALQGVWERANGLPLEIVIGAIITSETVTFPQELKISSHSTGNHPSEESLRQSAQIQEERKALILNHAQAYEILLMVYCYQHRANLELEKMEMIELAGDVYANSFKEEMKGEW